VRHVLPGGFTGAADFSILVFLARIDGGLLAAFKPGTGLAELTSPSHSRPWGRNDAVTSTGWPVGMVSEVCRVRCSAGFAGSCRFTGVVRSKGILNGEGPAVHKRLTASEQKW
jgi:hypothetical protein